MKQPILLQNELYFSKDSPETLIPVDLKKVYAFLYHLIQTLAYNNMSTICYYLIWNRDYMSKGEEIINHIHLENSIATPNIK